ncbi:MAG: class GN sortase [Alphaproteobacteria bacterium]|nr:class GN sortase [Alphaproteobacteria bacterium]
MHDTASGVFLRPPRAAAARGGAKDADRLQQTALAVALAFAVVGAGFLGKGLYIHAKAWAAQALIHRAWDARQAGEPAPRPWPWADTHPVARLRVPELAVDQIVLAGATGRTLAFGPAQLDGTARAGNAGATVLTGHRDTHFAFLRRLDPGMTVDVETPDGGRHRYRVVERAVVHRDQAALPPETADGDAWLVLATCWPFDAVDPGTPWRYLVTAKMM